MRSKFGALFTATVLALTVPWLAACSTGGSSTADDTSQESSNETSARALELESGWAKSADADGMTGVFGTLVNSGEDDLIITGVESDDAGMIELHEVTADGVMQEIQGDVTIPALDSYELAPGANHIMLMHLNRDLLAGDEVTFTLHLSSSGGAASSAEFTVLVKDYAGANEDYGDLAHEEDGGHEEHEDGHDGH